MSFIYGSEDFSDADWDEIVEEGTSEADMDWRRRAARDAFIPPHILARLAARCDDFFVRIALAENPRTPDETLIRLAENSDQSVLSSLANRGSLPVEAMKLMVSTAMPSKILRVMAARTDLPSELYEALADDSSYANLFLANNTGVPPYLLLKLSKSLNPEVRMLVSENPACPPEVLRTLSQDKDPRMSYCVAGNPSTPPDVLRELDDRRLFESFLLSNPSTPVDVLLRIACHPQKDSFRKIAVRRLMNEDSSFSGFPYEWVESAVCGGTQ